MIPLAVVVLDVQHPAEVALAEWNHAVETLLFDGAHKPFRTTWRGLVTYYTVFVIDLASRRVRILGSTPFPNDLFMGQVVRTLTVASEGALPSPRALICDRDAKWSGPSVNRIQPHTWLRRMRFSSMT